MKKYNFSGDEYINSIAIVGMAGTFNDAPDVAVLWKNLVSGHEAVRRLSDEDLRANGCPQEMLKHPRFVPASAMMREAEFFDAAFFGFTPAEARMMDPQLRLILQTAWHAFENANIVPGKSDGLTGVFAGAHPSSYLACVLGPEFLIHKGMETLSASIVNGQDFLSTWVSYKLGLTGPSLNIQTACSTGLVAVATACQNLLDYSCDTALAIAGAVFYPRNWGYLSETGSIYSQDGHCRPFDVDSSGTIAGEGVGAVVLKRLADALEDDDSVLGVIRGYAVNNDGAKRAGYTTPSVTGQRKLLEQALASAHVERDRVSYLETHGTGTQLGDPVEFAALDAVFGRQREFPCFLGAIKANLGHLGACAGMVGLLKVLLMFQHGKIPPQINFAAPNPEIPLAESGFQINTGLLDWETEGTRIAGVSSFGLGGTNCHIIIESPDLCQPRSDAQQRAENVLPLCLSAKSKTALRQLCLTWSEHLASLPENTSVRHQAVSALEGRSRFAWRAAVPMQNKEEAVRALVAPSDGMFAHCEAPPSRVAVIIGEDVGLDAEEISALAVHIPAFALYAEPLRQRYGLDIFALGDAALARPVGMALSLGLVAVLRQAGIRPGTIAGVGMGKLSALAAMNEFSPEDAFAHVTAEPAPSIWDGWASLEPHLTKGIELCVVIGRCGDEAVPSFPVTAGQHLVCLPLLAPAAPGFSVVSRLSHGLAGLFKSGVPFSPGRLENLPHVPLYPFEKNMYRPESGFSSHAGMAGNAAPAAEPAQATCSHDRTSMRIASPEPWCEPGVSHGDEDIQTVLASIWGNALGVEHIDPDDDFFEKGGTSLSAIKIIAETEKYTGISLPIREFLSLGTLRRVLEKLAEEAARETLA